MQTKTFKKPSCIVDFNNEAEIDAAIAEWENDFKHWRTMTFEELIKRSDRHIESLTIN